MSKILITGAVGQIGSELTILLSEKYGKDNIIAAGHKTKPTEKLLKSSQFIFLDITNKNQVADAVKKHEVKTIYHLAAILSAIGEQNPKLAWDVNTNGLYNVLEIAREQNCAVFIPSSIAVFGPETPKDNTPQDTIQRPTSMYGVTKVTGELLADYYHKRFAVDTRGVRFPGIISSETLPGGGVTDYAVEIFYQAIKNKKYTCFLQENTVLDMMYMPDALKCALDLMLTDSARLKHRNAFNVTAMSFTPKQLAEEIKKHIPDFEIDYKIDSVKQEIADSWPNHMDDSIAKQEWGWSPSYNLETMTEDMIKKLTIKIKLRVS